MIKRFKSLTDFEAAFPDEDACIQHFRAVRWPHGVPCVHCGSMERVYDLKLGRYKCGECGGKFTVRHDTIFGDSKLPLKLWFKAIFLMTSHKKGISSHQLARDLGITQKSAWFVLHRIREASLTQEFNGKLTGTVEMDEVFVGGQGKWKHKARKSGKAGPGGTSKKPALGMLQRGGDLRLMAMKPNKEGRFDFDNLKGLIYANIEPGTMVHTDEAAHYRWMNSGEYGHAIVKHSLDEYVIQDVTTNRIEGAFGHFKRAVHGVYHKVSDEHLDRYLQMFAWRWNRRTMEESERVNALLKATPKRRLTYKALTRKMDG